MSGMEPEKNPVPIFYSFSEKLWDSDLLDFVKIFCIQIENTL